MPDTVPADDTVPTPDVLVVGAGVTGIYQLHLARAAGFDAMLVDAGDGPGGTWFWNRYPGARFDSESYTYGYFFSEELFVEWEWQEHFAGQPETERYFNHVVDRFDLRRHMCFGVSVLAATWGDAAGRWIVETDRGHIAARHLVAATGVLSVPHIPAFDGIDDFAGAAHHTGRWPTEPVDLAGRRVAVVGTGSSGVQVIPEIAPEVAELTVYQRSANWCTPLNNRPITDEEQAALRADFESIRHTVATSVHGFLHRANDRSTFDDDESTRRAFYEEMWNSPGFTKLTSNYLDLTADPAANAAFCDFVAGKIREIVHDPATAARLIPSDHRFSEKRPPFVAGYYETFNRDNLELVDTQATPIRRLTATGIETSDRHRDHDVIVWATGWDFGTGALERMGIVGRGGLRLVDHWADGPTTFLGIMTDGFPNLYFPGGPHAAAGNNPRYNGDQVDFIHEALERLRSRGDDVLEVDLDAVRRWTDMVDRGAEHSPFGERSYYFGTNIAGKPRKYLLNSGGRPKLFKEIERVRSNDWAAFRSRPVSS